MSGQATYMVGDSLAKVAELPAGSVDLVLTSPPFLNLRSYLPDDHADKGAEVGAESGPGPFVDTLLDHTEAWRRVLAPHGSIAVEIGDTYSGTGGAGGDWSDSEHTTLARRKGGGDGGPIRRVLDDGWPMAKSLCLVPELYRLALAYGRNPITGRETDRWMVRNNVRWCRPAPPVGALADKFRPATSDFVMATGSRTRYWDGVAVRSDTGPPLDFWVVNTAGYRGAHFATWPAALLTRPILAMCPLRVCRECGEPSRRIVAKTRKVSGKVGLPADSASSEVAGCKDENFYAAGETTYATEGWTDCGHDAWRPGVVLDPFAGSGTTLVVATGHGRDAIGVDLDERNAAFAIERCGMFVEVV